MRKTLLLLFVGIAMTANAQTVVSTSLSASRDTTACVMACKHQGNQRHKAGKHHKISKGKRGHVPAFMSNLDEADRAVVNELMGSYRKDCKAIKEKYGIRKNTNGEKPTEQQMDDMVKARVARRTAVLKLQEKYYDKLRKVLSPQQAAAILGICGRGNGCPTSSHGHKGSGNCQGHHACGMSALCPCTNK